MNKRYLVKYQYGRYEIRDAYNDHCVCFSYTSEDAQQIADAMNTQHEHVNEK
jgi:hypothetical protein